MVFLNDEFWYEKIPYQYALYRKKITVDKETGQEKTAKQLIGYYNTLEGLLTAAAKELTDDKIARGEITTIQEHIETMQKNIEEVISNGTGDM